MWNVERQRRRTGRANAAFPVCRWRMLRPVMLLSFAFGLNLPRRKFNQARSRPKKERVREKGKTNVGGGMRTRQFQKEKEKKKDELGIGERVCGRRWEWQLV